MDKMSVINPFPSGAIRKKEPNPTNWQFAELAKPKALTKDILPVKVSIKDKFPPVFHQIYGNCTSTAVLGADAYYYHTSKWDPSTVYTYYNQRRIDHVKTEKDIGSCIETALVAVRKYGACSAKVWPNDKPYTEKPSKEAYADGKHGHEVTSYYQIKTILQAKKALSLGYPVCIFMSWPFKYMDENYILNTPTKREAFDTDDAHAIVLVGYDDKKELFEFRNSWGKEWANDGYAYFTYKAVNNCAIWDDTYAVVK